MVSEQIDPLEVAEEIIARIDPADLPRLEEALAQRRRELALDDQPATVLERRSHEHGELVLERRSYTRKDGSKNWRGPYWYFHFRDGSRNRTIYLGKTDDPEAALAAKRGKS